MAVLIVAALLGPTSPATAGAPLRQLPAVVHVHSTWTTGDQSLNQLAELAPRRGVGAIFLAENFQQRFEYGLPPLRSLLRYRMEYPSILQKGPQAFLAAVSAVNAQQARVLFVPGVEVIPLYYWSGNLLNGSLTMHDGQKNILALGLLRADDYRELPAVGNPHSGHWGWRSALYLSPLLLLLCGGWLLTQRRRRVVHLRRFRLVESRRPVALSLLTIGVGLALLANNYPFRVAPFSPYDSDPGLAPFQSVIDHVASRGGLSVWSLPEARDFQVVHVAGLTATIRTEPYADDLLETDRFAAFGGIYEDTTTFTNPGAGWDHLLLEFLGGRRRAPAWAIGEAAYHHEGQAGKRFGEVQTVLLIEGRETAHLLEAFRIGRMYALQRTVEAGLRLDRFQIALPDQPPAQAGGQLNVSAGAQPEVQAAIEGTPDPMPITARLIRSGAVVHTAKGTTPLSVSWVDRELRPGGRVFYRLEVQGPGGHRILSNPIFVTSADR
jgi:hypothetical protein